MAAIAFSLAHTLWRDLVGPLRQTLVQRGAHPSRCVVLLPYAQLMPVARAAWAASGDGFMPQWETTMNWAGRMGARFAPGELDIRFDTACDLLTASRWLEQAGLAAQRDELAPALVDAAWQLAAVVSAQPPQHRAAWAATARAGLTAGMEGLDKGLLRFEAAVARIALEWAVASSYASDALFDDATRAGVDCLVLVRGLQPDALAEALALHYAQRACVLDLAAPAALADAAVAPEGIRLHACPDAHDEADRAAACVLRHLAARSEGSGLPVALVANDRSLVRRVRALLGARGVTLRDETGWKLSTTHAAASLMAVLRAAAHHADADTVLDWAKQAPACDAATTDRLERALRKAGTPDWSAAPAINSVADQINAWRASLQAGRPLAAWLLALREVLEASGQWALLQADDAGREVLRALYLDVGRSVELPATPRRQSLGDFTRWVNAVLEGASFKPDPPEQPDVVVLPLSQLLGRPVAAVVVPGCDETHLPVSPDPPGTWTTPQRALLGLPQRPALQAAAHAAWRYLLQSGAASPGTVDLLWRTHEGGEALQPSGFVQALRLRHSALAADPRNPRPVQPQAVPAPQPRADALPLATLSASAYGDLRACPYRFFALRCLGLAEAEELDATLDKRDFGNWLHLVLTLFHRALQEAEDAGAAPAESAWPAIISVAAGQATQSLRIDAAGFTPFAAAWPRVRDGYLRWLAGHQASGARFAEAETWKEQPLGRVRLVGKIDRIDTLPGGQRMVMDYKTESLASTRQRLADPLDDTQLAFYAALLDDDALQAAYINVGEKDGTHTCAMDDITALRDTLVEGMAHDMDRIAAGEALPALGEGSACDWCAARGLCRKDFWS